MSEQTKDEVRATVREQYARVLGARGREHGPRLRESARRRRLRSGEAVLYLGSGGGFDCFLAAKQVGASGRVIGVDMTEEMVTKARANAAKLDAKNVEFRLGSSRRATRRRALPVPSARQQRTPRPRDENDVIIRMRGRSQAVCHSAR